MIGTLPVAITTRVHTRTDIRYDASTIERKSRRIRVVPSQSRHRAKRVSDAGFAVRA